MGKGQFLGSESENSVCVWEGGEGKKQVEHKQKEQVSSTHPYYFLPLTHTFVGLLTRCSEVFSRLTNFIRFTY